MEHFSTIGLFGFSCGVLSVIGYDLCIYLLKRRHQDIWQKLDRPCLLHEIRTGYENTSFWWFFVKFQFLKIRDQLFSLVCLLTYMCMVVAILSFFL